MIDAAWGKRQVDVSGRAGVRLLVATWAEALPLIGFAPQVTGMGRRSVDLGECQAVLSAGFAGACRAGLQPGDVLLAGDAGKDLRERLGAIDGELRTVDHVASPAEKAALGRQGVAALDMETAWLAAAASMPFVSVRVIIDRLQDRAVSFGTARHYVTASRSLRAAVAEAYGVLSGVGAPSPQPSPAGAGEGVMP
jgi:hypothetical protein